MKVAHLSDLHIGKHISQVKLEALGRDLVSEGLDLLIVSGDITDRGRIWQFRLALDFLRSLKIPFITVPGNREISVGAVWEWMFPATAMRRYRGFFGDHDRVVYQSDEQKAVFFGLNSVHRFPSWPGTIARKSRYWLKEKATGFPGYFKVLFLHHPVLPVIRSSSFWAHTLSDAGEVLNLCTQTGISLILQGHKHRSSVMEIRFPERRASVVVSSCGAPLMPHWDSVYHVIKISQPLMVIQPREFSAGTFEGKSSHQFSTNPNEADPSRTQ